MTSPNLSRSPRPSRKRQRGNLDPSSLASRLVVRNQELFDLMSRDHGLSLLDSEMYEIEIVVARMLARDRK